MTGFLRALGAVAAAAFGVRRGRDAVGDWARIRPAQILAAAVLSVLLFVVLLAAIVRAVLS